MTNSQPSTLARILDTQVSAASRIVLLRTIHISPPLLANNRPEVSRAVLAAALNLLLFKDLLERVPTGRLYVAEATSRGRLIVFDHGAVRTVALASMGQLPVGETAIKRMLLPLGYTMGDLYPLDRLGMTGRSYAHTDFKEELPQFFVSELHPERFSAAFQAAVARVTGTSRDPLSAAAKCALEALSALGHLCFDRASALLPELLACFQRQHAIPSLRDYEILLTESPEMAWISTEGNAFNHATDRVLNLDALVAEQRALGRPLKDTIERSRSGRVRQTAFKADRVEREFVDERGGLLRREVPGSFYEFIQREEVSDPVSRVSKLDLAFDSSNAQGIFKMTAVA